MNEKIKELYDAESQINFEKIEKLIQKHAHKKIYCFGSGSAAEILCKQPFFENNIKGFLDNNKALWGSKIHEIEIMSPQIIEHLERGKYIILILSKHLSAITKQLCIYGLEEEKDYIDIYSEFAAYYRIKKFQLSAGKYLTFLEQIPKEMFIDIKHKNDNHIGVVCIVSMVDWETWYAITIFLILHAMGYKVTLIMDNLKSFDDFIYFNKHSEIAKIYTDYIVQYISEKFEDLDIRFLNEQEKEDITQEDIKEIQRLVKINLTWQNPKTDELRGVSKEEREKKFEHILRDNMAIIKSFFNYNSFDTINVITALHKSRGLYMWEGLRHKLRVSSYDGAGKGTTLCATNYPCSHHYDNLKIITEKMFDEMTRNEIVKITKKDFEERIHVTSDTEGYNFQACDQAEENQKFYDVIIPLNVNCDGAAIGQDRVFHTEREWLFRTIDFILKETDASIMVREHPAAFITDFRYFALERYEEEINCRYAGNDRVFFCSGDKSINTYRMIEKSKLVLPYASTIGLEAVLLGKPVITHTKVYYSNFDYIYNAIDEREYFELVKSAISDTLYIKNYCEDEKWIALNNLLNTSLKTEFRETTDVWMDYSFNELIQSDCVRKMVQTFARGVPMSYLNSKELCAKNNEWI